MELTELKKRKVLILGFGREGRDTFKFLRKFFPKKIIGIGDCKLKIANLRDKKVKLYLGERYLKALTNYEVIIKSPGIPLKLIKPYLTKKQKLTSQTDLFFENFPGIIVGVTGTKGKSTTSLLIYKILKRCPKLKRRVHLVGNIGRPVLSHLKKAKKGDIFVYELSSHQLQSIKKSPKIAVLLNIYPEHLDYYRSFKDYVRAKSNIAKYQTKNDFLVYNFGDKIVRKIAQKSKARKIPFSGKYYQQDITAAKIVGRIFKIPKDWIEKAIDKFKRLPHRLEYVGRFRGIEFYNDSLSTVPQATIEALDFFGNKVQTLILGGFDRGVEFGDLAKRISKSEVKTVILFPKSGERIYKALKKLKAKLNYFFTFKMTEAVKISYLKTGVGKICLLSPASPSFGVFKDYKERGNLFKKYVKYYAKVF